MSISNTSANRRLAVHLNHLVPSSVDQSVVSQAAAPVIEHEQCRGEVLSHNSTFGSYSFPGSENDRYSSISWNYNHTFDVKKMNDLLNGGVDKKALYKFLDNPLLLKRTTNLPKEEARELVLQQVVHLCKSGRFRISEMKKDPEGLLQRIEASGLIATASNVKMGETSRDGAEFQGKSWEKHEARHPGG